MLKADKCLTFVRCHEIWEPETARILGVVMEFLYFLTYLIHAFQLESCHWVKLRTDIISTECYVGNCMKLSGRGSFPGSVPVIV